MESFRVKDVLTFRLFCETSRTTWISEPSLRKKATHAMLNRLLYTLLRMRTRCSALSCSCAPSIIQFSANAHQTFYAFLHLLRMRTKCSALSCSCAPAIIQFSAHAQQIFYVFLYFLRMRIGYSTIFACRPNI